MLHNEPKVKDSLQPALRYLGSTYRLRGLPVEIPLLRCDGEDQKREKKTGGVPMSNFDLCNR